jgi:hypothetical protein
MNNTKINLKWIGYESTDLIHILNDRDQLRAVVNMIMNLQDP